MEIHEPGHREPAGRIHDATALRRDASRRSDPRDAPPLDKDVAGLRRERPGAIHDPHAPEEERLGYWRRVCDRPADPLLRAGVVVVNQCPLIAGINDDVATMKALCEGLVRMRVRASDGSTLPEVVVRLALGEEAGCLENSFQRLCRPRRPSP